MLTVKTGARRGYKTEKVLRRNSRRAKQLVPRAGRTEAAVQCCDQTVGHYDSRKKRVQGGSGQGAPTA